MSRVALQDLELLCSRRSIIYRHFPDYLIINHTLGRGQKRQHISRPIVPLRENNYYCDHEPCWN